MISALSVTVLTGFAALSIDAARLQAAASQNQSNVDAAALAALVVYRNEIGVAADPVSRAQAAADYVLDQNLVAEQRGEHHVELEFTMGHWDWGAEDRESAYTEAYGGEEVEFNAVQVVGARIEGSDSTSVDLLMGSLFGGPGKVEISNVATGAMRFRDILVVFDTTTSLDAVEMANEKAATVAFLETLSTFRLPGDQVGLVTFVGDAQVHQVLTNLDAADAMVASWESDLGNCYTSPDHYYGWYWTDGSSYHDDPDDNPSNVWPYRWTHEWQGAYGYDFTYMALGDDGVMDPTIDYDELGPAEKVWYDLRKDTTLFTDQMLPCNYGRDSGQFYGPGGECEANSACDSTATYPGVADATRRGYIVYGYEKGSWDQKSHVESIEYYWTNTGTNQYRAVEVAYDELEADPERADALKVMVIITDGLPECANPRGSSWEECSLWLKAKAEALGADICNKDDRYSIFTVSYNDYSSQYASCGTDTGCISYYQTLEGRQSDLLQNLACGHGKFYETPDSSELPEILRAVAREIPVAVVQ